MSGLKYQQVCNLLDEKIRNGEFSGRLPGMLRLSKQLGVHHVTLKKAMDVLVDRGLLHIDGTRGTFVNLPCENASLGMRSFGIFGMQGLLSINYLNEKYKERNCRLIAFGLPSSLQPDSVLEFLQPLKLSAAVFLGSSARRELMQTLLQKGLPIIGNVQEGLPWMNGVEFAHYDSYKIALQHLYELGHRRVAFVETARPQEFQYYLDRIRRAYQDVLGEDFDPQLFSVDGNVEEYYQKYGEAYLEEIFYVKMRRFLNLPSPPSALIIQSSYLNAGMDFLRSHNVRIPQELSVVSVCARSALNPYFSSLCLDQTELIDWAVERLLQMLDGELPPIEKKMFIMPFNHGQSTITYKESTNMESKA